MAGMENAMKVNVKLFATLTRYRSGEKAGNSFEINLVEGASAFDLINLLQIPAAEIHIVFVNNIIQEPSIVLTAGDVIGIFPPVGGG